MPTDTPIHFPPAVRRRFFAIFRPAAVLLGLVLMACFGSAWAAGPAELSGELDVIIKEDFDRGRFETDYFLRDETGQDWYQLKFERTPPGHLRSGQHVRVRGQAQGRKFQVESLDEPGAAAQGGKPTGAEGTADLAAQAVDEHRAVVLMVNLSNASVSLTRDQITGYMYSNSRSVDGLYREASLGQMSFPADTDGNGQADVFGPFTINYDNSTCDYYGWASAAETAAQAAGINLSLYKHRVFVLPNTASLPNCSWAGIANVGCGTYCRAWIAGSTGMIFAHELGHNLNLAHAGTDPGNDGTVDNVYGDYSDPMGSSSSSWYLFNAGHIDQMGWYAGIPGAITTVTSGGTYDLAAIGSDPLTAGAATALKIAKPDTGDFYYLSYRQAIGNYNQLSSTYTKGINIHRYRGTGYGYTSHIKTLSDGASFTDAANGITVTQLSQGGGYATVQVSYGCAAQTPAVAIAPATLAVRPGDPANFSVTVTNQDAGGCGETLFTLTSTGGTLAPNSLRLAAGQSGQGVLAADANRADGSYTLTVTAADADGAKPDHATNGKGGATLIVDGTPPSPPAGLAGSVDRQGRVNLSWQASSDALSGVAWYVVYRDGAAIGQTSGAGYTDGTAAGGSYVYAVVAFDGAGNASAASDPVQVTAGGSTGGNGKSPKK